MFYLHIPYALFTPSFELFTHLLVVVGSRDDFFYLHPVALLPTVHLSKQWKEKMEEG